MPVFHVGTLWHSRFFHFPGNFISGSHDKLEVNLGCLWGGGGGGSRRSPRGFETISIVARQPSWWGVGGCRGCSEHGRWIESITTT